MIARMPPSSHPAAPLALLLFPLMWCGALGLLSATGGWRALARRFPSEGTPPANRRWMVWGELGWVTYRSTLTVGHSEAGLHLAVFPMFRPFHPPLLIPWKSISARTRGRYWLMMCDQLAIDAEHTVWLRLQTSTTSAFERHLPPVA